MLVVFFYPEHFFLITMGLERITLNLQVQMLYYLSYKLGGPQQIF